MSSSKSNYQKVDSPQQQQQQRKGCCACWAWFKENPWERKSFFYWVLFGLATLVLAVLFISSPTIGYIVSGLFVVLIAGLREQVDNYKKNNEAFKAENEQLSQEVDKLQKAKNELEEVSSTLKEGNIRLEQSLNQFRELDKNLQELGSDNLEGMKLVQERSKTMLDRWKINLIEQEKDMIADIFDRFESEDEKENMTQNEFKRFLEYLPDKYAKSKDKLNLKWKDLAGDDGEMNEDEFRKLLDTWVEGVVNSEWKEKQQTDTKLNPPPEDSDIKEKE